MAQLLKAHRLQHGFSSRELARLSGVNQATVIRLERGDILTPQPETLRALGKTLGLSSFELFTTAEWLPPDELPNLGAYLRSKYHELPESAVRELQAHLHELSDQIDKGGPTDGEDEKDIATT